VNLVLDACAMIAYLRGEPGSDVVRNLLVLPENSCFAHAVNLCEVYYHFVRSDSVETARAALRDLSAVGIHSRRNMSTSFWMRVGEIKGTIGRIALGDCFAIGLAQVLHADVVTSDHHEFDPLVGTGICGIRFIR
jgi:PIN domain nuclease of toxin-antitoxin system